MAPFHDPQQTLTHLQALGYEAGDKIYIRLLAPKDSLWKPTKSGKAVPTVNGYQFYPIDGYLTLHEKSASFTRLVHPKDDNGKSIKSEWIDSTYYVNGLSYLSKENRKGYGVYLVVNPGGRNSDSITHAFNLFYESDDKTKDEQWQSLRTLEGALRIEASLVIETKNSLHVYFRLTEEETDLELWTKFQQRLIQTQDSDPSIFNPDRLMRLAGFNHQKYSESTNKLITTPVCIVQFTESETDLNTFNNVLVKWDADRWEKDNKNIRRKANKSSFTPTDPSLVPWDIRNLAKYLPGYTPDGRNGWDTVDCPLAHSHEAGYQHIHINQSTGQYKAHCGCDTVAFYQKAREAATAAGYNPKPKTESNIIPFQKKDDDSWLERYQEASRKAWEDSKQFSPTHEINQQYVSIEAGLLAGADIHALKSTMSTGKTQELISILNTSDAGAVAIGSRNSLLLQSCERWGNFYHLHEHEAKDLVGDPYSRIACCVDSLMSFQDSDFDGKIIILDESLSVVKHALQSSTLRGRREKCLPKFEQAIKRASLVIAWDGNNSDIAIDYLKALRGKGSRVVKQLNHYKGEILNIEMIRVLNDEGQVSLKCEAPLLTKLGESMDAFSLIPKSEARAIVVIADNKKKLQAIDKTYSDKGFKVLRVDADSVGEEHVKRFLKNPDNYLENNQVDLLLLSPTAESGIDISIKNYFQKGFALFYGNIDTDTQKQFLRRVRKCLDWAVWCQEYTVNDDIDTTKSPFANQVSKQLIEFLTLDCQLVFNKFNREELIKGFLEKIARDIDNPHNQADIKFLASRNYELKHLRECLKASLEKDGHKVSMVDCHRDDVQHCTVEAIKMNKKAIIKAKAKAIFNAEDISYASAMVIKSAFGASVEAREQAEKAILKHRLPGIEESEIWGDEFIAKVLFEDRNLITRLTRYWFLTNMHAAKLQAQAYWESLAEKDTLMLSDIRSDYAYLRALDNLGIWELAGEEGFDNCSDKLVDIHRRCKRSRGLQKALRRKPGKLGIIDWVSRLCASVEIESRASKKPSAQRKDKGGDRIYRYVDPRLDSGKSTILKCLDEKFEKFCNANTAQTQTELDLDPVHLDQFLYTKVGGGGQAKSIDIQRPEVDSSYSSENTLKDTDIGAAGVYETPKDEQWYRCPDLTEPMRIWHEVKRLPDGRVNLVNATETRSSTAYPENLIPWDAALVS